jgi:hypothetical protein
MLNAQAKQLVNFVLSIDLDTGIISTGRRSADGQEHHRVIPTLPVTLPMVRIPEVAAIAQRETANKGPRKSRR